MEAYARGIGVKPHAGLPQLERRSAGPSQGLEDRLRLVLRRELVAAGEPKAIENKDRVDHCLPPFVAPGPRLAELQGKSFTSCRSAVTPQIYAGLLSIGSARRRSMLLVERFVDLVRRPPSARRAADPGSGRLPSRAAGSGASGTFPRRLVRVSRGVLFDHGSAQADLKRSDRGTLASADAEPDGSDSSSGAFEPPQQTASIHVWLRRLRPITQPAPGPDRLKSAAEA